MLLLTIEMPGECRAQRQLDFDWRISQQIRQWLDVLLSTYSEVIVHISGENGAVVVWPLQVGRLIVLILSKLFFEPFLVVDHNLLAVRLHKAYERLDDLESSATKWNENQDLTMLGHLGRKILSFLFSKIKDIH